MSAGIERTPASTAPGSEIHSAVLTLLYREADALDNYRFEEWLSFFAPEIEYVMPVRTTQFLVDGKGFNDEATFFSENLESLTTRVRRLETEFAWAETPPSRTRHFISNVLVERGDEGTLEVRASFMTTRTRQDNGYQMFTGERRDRLRPGDDGQYLIARRLILPDQTVITATNLSVFF
jgi:PAH dioxygenase small subunit